jgi:hypothetical protein
LQGNFALPLSDRGRWRQSKNCTARRIHARDAVGLRHSEKEARRRSRTGLLQFIETRWEREPNDLSKDSQLEQVCAYLLTAYLREGSISSLPFTKRHESALVGAANNALGVLALRIKVPASLAVRHSGVSAVSLQHLLTYFQQYEGDIEDLLPAPPESRDAYQRMSKIMAVVNTQA